jgi:uncharacterized membrane protein
MQDPTDLEKNNAAPADGHSPGGSALYRWLPLLLIVLGTFLRFYRIGWHSLWADEGAFVFIARMEPGAMIHFIATYESHPPLGFLLLHPFFALGDSALILRIPSALFASLSLIVGYFLAKRMFNATTALVTLFFLVFNSAQIYILQEIRMYPFFIFLSLLGTYLFYEMTESRKSSMPFLYGLTCAAMCYTHYFGAVVMLMHALSALIFFRERTFLIRLFAAQIGAALLFLPWVKVMAAQSQAARTTPLPFMLGTLISTFINFFSGYTFDAPLWSLEFIVIFALALVLPIAGVVLSLRFGDRRRELLFSLFYMLFPNVALALISVFNLKHFYALKYFAFTSPFYFMIIAYSLDRGLTSGKKVVTTLFLFTYLFINCMGLSNLYFLPTYQKQRWKEAAAYVNHLRMPDDAVLIQDSFQVYVFEFYSAIKDKNVYMITPESLPKSIESIAAKHRRIWYIASARWQHKDPEHKVLKWLNDHMITVDSRVYTNVDPYANILAVLFEERADDARQRKEDLPPPSKNPE